MKTSVEILSAPRCPGGLLTFSPQNRFLMHKCQLCSSKNISKVFIQVPKFSHFHLVSIELLKR